MRGFRVAEVLRRQRARGGSEGPRGRRELPELWRERGGSVGPSGSAEVLRRGSGVARFSGRWRKSGGFGATKASAAAGFRRAEGARRVPRVGGDTDWWWLGSRGLCGGGGSRVDGASGRLFPGGVWRRFFDVIETAQASYAQGGGNRLLRGACLDAAGKSSFCGGPVLTQPENPAFAGTNPNAAGKSPILRVNCVPPAPIKKPPALPQVVDCQLSGRLDSNQRPPAPKAGALTGLRYTPSVPSFRYCRRRCRLAAPFAFQNSQNRLLHYAAAVFCIMPPLSLPLPSDGSSLPPWRAGHLPEVRGAKITAFSVPTNFSLRNLSPARRVITAEGTAAAEGHRRPEDRRRRDRPPSGIASGGASHFCSRPSKLPARRSCPLSRQTVEAARYRSGPSRLPAIAAGRRTGG